MLEHAKARLQDFQLKMQNAGIDIALLTDESTIAYYAGFWGYLSVEFGRPTFLVVPADGDPTVVTPRMESEMVSAMTWVPNIRTWEDSGPNHWGNVLAQILGTRRHKLGVEKTVLPSLIRNWLDDSADSVELTDASPLIGEMRAIKSSFEIGVMKQAGLIAAAMMSAAEDSLAEGAPEYESALAIINAGTRAAAGFLTHKGWERFVSPIIHNLQIMQSGIDTSMPHRRASIKTLEAGDPIYFCFCNMAQFKQYKLGFDRMFNIHYVSDQAADVQQTAIDAQQAALSVVAPGVTAETVAQAANEVYQKKGYAPSYRTGRSIGMAYLETPELKSGDHTILQEGMTFAVDGGISIEGQFGGRIGDSIVVTAEGFEYLTEYPREVVVVNR
ncbi:MAG: Xaa-Pro peptidase family protein [Pseudomonadota bacterium]|jgi:Xaa-Pro aminopeptidase|nr:aminopeptidase P family protein [Gammaproteobacteria bacterium]MDC0978984.1 Xaa-Pro peptidase family protein [Gammaproteobacteria bacterium]MDC3279628.1 Xaa-Pro peptidase family protein [Gammaproteobacteria bacterium]